MNSQRNFIFFIINLILALLYSNATDICPSDACADKPYGHKITDPNDCHGYLLCHGENVFQQYCAPGSKFIEEIQDCIVGTCPPCNCGTPPAPPTSSPPTPSPPTPSPPTPSPPTPPDDDPTAPDCTIYEHGHRFPHATHCRFFWQCVEGRAVRLFCEKGMWYDRIRIVCDFPSNVKNCPAMRD